MRIYPPPLWISKIYGGFQAQRVHSTNKTIGWYLQVRLHSTNKTIEWYPIGLAT